MQAKSKVQHGQVAEWDTYPPNTFLNGCLMEANDPAGATYGAVKLLASDLMIYNTTPQIFQDTHPPSPLFIRLCRGVKRRHV